MYLLLCFPLYLNCITIETKLSRHLYVLFLHTSVLSKGKLPSLWQMK